MKSIKVTKWYSISLNQICTTWQSHIFVLTAFLSALALLLEIEPYYFMCTSVHWPQLWNASLSSILYYLLILAGSREQWKQSQPPEPVGHRFNSTIYRTADLQEHSGLPAAIPTSNSKNASQNRTENGPHFRWDYPQGSALQQTQQAHSCQSLLGPTMSFFFFQGIILHLKCDRYILDCSAVNQTALILAGF